MSVWRSLLILALLMLVLPAATFAFRSNQLRGGSPVRNWQFHTVGRGDVSVAVTAIGAIEAESAVRLNFAEPGRVAEVLVQPGDAVRAGDVLLHLADDNQRVAYAQALLSLQLAELQKQTLLEPPKDWEIRVAEANIASAQGAYTSIARAVSGDDIRAAELRLQQAQTAEEDARRARASADGGQPEEAYQLLDAQIGAATFNIEIARLQLESLQRGSSDQLAVAGARIAQAQRELERLQAGPTEIEINRADIAIEQAKIQVEQAALALERAALVALFDGVVAAVNVEVGALVTPGLPVVELVDAESLSLTVQVDEIDIRRIEENMPAQIELDALPGVRFASTLEQIALLGRSDGGIISYDVRLALDASDARVRVGMTAEASIVVEESRDTLVVPNTFIRLDRRTDRAFVNLLAADGTFSEIEIALGLRGQDMSEVVSGLRAGDVIVIDLGSERFDIFGSG